MNILYMYRPTLPVYFKASTDDPIMYGNGW